MFQDDFPESPDSGWTTKNYELPLSESLFLFCTYFTEFLEFNNG